MNINKQKIPDSILIIHGKINAKQHGIEADSDTTCKSIPSELSKVSLNVS
jgi:hypothetical protein